MKYVYVLTSTNNDYLYEQCLISIHSLLKYDTEAEIIVLTDNLTMDGLVGFRSEIFNYGKVISKEFDNKYSMKVRSRLLKTSMRSIVSGNFLYLDLDTVITAPLEEIELSGADIAMVLDKHINICGQNEYVFHNVYYNAKKMGYRVGYQNCHFNSGVIYVSDSKPAKDFFALWHYLYLDCLEKGIDIDQTSLNEANCRMKGIVRELDGIWNVQINSGLKYLSESKVIHYLGFQPRNKQNIYFNTLPFLLCDEGLLEDVKNKRCITENVKQIIDAPRQAFKTVTIVPEDCVAYKLMFSNHMRLFKFYFVKCNLIYKIFEKIFGVLFYLIYKRV